MSNNNYSWLDLYSFTVVDRPAATYKIPSSRPKPSSISDASSISDSSSIGGTSSITIEPSSNSPKLPPTDRGKAAWSFLFASFMIDGLQFGFALTFGVFQSYYNKQPGFANDPNIAVIGTLSTGVYYLGAPFMTYLIRTFPKSQQFMIWFGWLLCIVALIGASFSNTVFGLVATQGALYSLGVTILYYPMMGMLNEWFILKRGLAFGIMSAATGVSGTGLPFVLETMLEKYGYKTTLRGVAIALAVLTGPVLPLLRGRLPSEPLPSQSVEEPSEKEEPKEGELVDQKSYFKKPLFYFFAASILFQGLGFSFPSIFLPSYSSLLGYSPTTGALLVALYSLMSTFGQVTCGFLSDGLVSVEMLAFTFPFISGISILVLWGFARSLAPLVIFALMYGFWGGGYVVLWSKMGLRLSSDPLVGLSLFGWFAFARGIGNVATGPVSAALTGPTVSRSDYGIGEYKMLVIYSGMCMLLCSSLTVFLWTGKLVKRFSSRKEQSPSCKHCPKQ